MMRKNIFRRFVKIVRSTLIALVLAMSVGCGFRSVVVPNLDWLIGMRINKVLELEGKEKKQLYKDISVILEKSKPTVARIQDKLKTADLKKIDFEREQVFFRSEYEAMVEIVLPYYSRYLSRMSPEQIERLRKSNKEADEKILEEIKQANQKNLEFFESFLGTLTTEQKKIIKTSSKNFVNSRVERLKRRKRYRKQLDEIFLKTDTKTRESEIMEISRKYVKASRTSEFAKLFIATCRSVIEISNSQQQSKFREKLNEYSKWLESLIATKYN